jgi:hypothetical protein
MAARRGEEPHWVRYEVSHLIRQHVSAWEYFCRDRDRLQEGPLRDSPSAMHRANNGRATMETTAKLLDMALGTVGSVQFGGKLYEEAHSLAHGLKDAPPGTQDASGLFVEIVSPLNGKARKAK